MSTAARSASSPASTTVASDGWCSRATPSAWRSPSKSCAACSGAPGRWPRSTARWRWRGRCRSSCHVTSPWPEAWPMAEGGTRMREERRVVVTGMGAITPIGNDVASFWEGLMAGRSGIDRISSFDPSQVDSKVAGEIKGFNAEEVMPKKEVRRNDTYVHYAWAAAAEALRDAGMENPITDEALAERTGVIVGS